MIKRNFLLNVLKFCLLFFLSFLNVSVRSKTLLIQYRFDIESLNMSAIFFKEKLILSGVVFALYRFQYAVNLKSFPFHLLVMTSTLIVIPSFNEFRHHSEHFVKDRILSILKLFPINFQKHSILDFFLLSPMTLSFIYSLLIIADLM